MDNDTTTGLATFAAPFLDPVTNELRHLLQIINSVIISGIVSLFGVGANIVNIIVFVHQGFKDIINISLLGLSVADLVCSVTMFWTSTCYNLLLYDLDLPFEPMDVMYITGGLIHVCFNRITSFITAFITLERCLCITLPLKVRSIFTPFRTKVIILSIFLSTISMFVPFYFVSKLEWKFNTSRNRSILVFTVTENKEIVEAVTFFIHSVFLSTVLLVTVVVCTIMLAVKLIQKTKWRQASVAQTMSNSETTSTKDKKVVKMITLIATIFLICYIPPTLIFLVMVFIPGFDLGGRFENLLYSIWTVLFVLDAINSSVNIVVYFNMSTKYRITFLKIFCVFPQESVVFVNKQRM